MVGKEGRRFNVLLVMHAEMAQTDARVPQKDGEGGEPVVPGSQISVLCCITAVRTI